MPRAIVGAPIARLDDGDALVLVYPATFSDSGMRSFVDVDVPVADWDALTALSLQSGVRDAVVAAGTDLGYAFANTDVLNTALGSQSYEHIAEVILTSSAADISFTSIPAIYRELRVDFALRSDRSGQKYDNIYVQMNGDTGSNYDWFYLKGLSNVVQGSTQIAGGACYLGTIPAASAPANKAGMGRVRFPDYSRTAWHKTALAQSLAVGANVDGDVQLWLVESLWRNTAAVSSLRIYTQFGQLISGSVATLWGVN